MSDAETGDEPPEAEPAAEADPEEVPASVPDDWLDQKPFDPAGR
jgi:hypothetical protein